MDDEIDGAVKRFALIVEELARPDAPELVHGPIRQEGFVCDCAYCEVIRKHCITCGMLGQARRRDTYQCVACSDRRTQHQAEEDAQRARDLERTRNKDDVWQGGSTLELIAWMDGRKEKVLNEKAHCYVFGSDVHCNTNEPGIDRGNWPTQTAGRTVARPKRPFAGNGAV